MPRQLTFNLARYYTTHLRDRLTFTVPAREPLSLLQHEGTELLDVGVGEAHGLHVVGHLLGGRRAGPLLKARDQLIVTVLVRKAGVGIVERRDLPVQQQLGIAHAQQRIQDIGERTRAVRARDAVEVDRVVLLVEEHAEHLREMCTHFTSGPSGEPVMP